MTKNYLVPLVLILVLLTGCSDHASNPLSPEIDISPGNGASTPSMAPSHLWGFYTCCIDLENSTVEAIPNRSIMGVEPSPFAWNVTSFLGDDFLTFDIIEIVEGSDGDYVDVDLYVQLTHPFPEYPEYNGYDVRGIFIGNGSKDLGFEGMMIAEDGVDQMMYNAYTPDPPEDGLPVMYTRWWNPTEFGTKGPMGYDPGAFASPGYLGTATVNPCEYFADGLGANEDLWEFLNTTENRGVFSAGSKNTRRYYLRFPTPDPGVVFNYAVVANWDGEDIHPANGPEAMAISVEVTNDLYYYNEYQYGGDLILDIGVFDWLSTITFQGPEDYDIFVISDMFPSPYQLTGPELEPTTPGAPLPQYHVEIPVYKLQGNVPEQFYVYIQYIDWNYGNIYDIPNNAGGVVGTPARDQALPEIIEYEPCAGIEITAFNPNTASVNDILTGVQLTGSGFPSSGPIGMVLLNIDGPLYDVNATNVTWQNSGLITCDFNFQAENLIPGNYILWYASDCDWWLPDYFTLTAN